jgi:hypothetical protein
MKEVLGGGSMVFKVLAAYMPTMQRQMCANTSSLPSVRYCSVSASPTASARHIPLCTHAATPCQRQPSQCMRETRILPPSSSEHKFYIDPSIQRKSNYPSVCLSRHSRTAQTKYLLVSIFLSIDTLSTSRSIHLSVCPQLYLSATAPISSINLSMLITSIHECYALMPLGYYVSISTHTITTRVYVYPHFYNEPTFTTRR